MNALSNVEQGGPEPEEAAGLTIGELADRTGVSAATLRVWETRYGFPVPHRLPSGHRRYPESLVATVQTVVASRDSGVRLDVAIRHVLAGTETPFAASTTPGAAGGAHARRLEPPSVYARLRRSHPHLAAQRLRKATLIGLSWAIEDEFCARSHRAHVFGSFQLQRHYASAEQRWTDLARTTASTFVFADFPRELATTELPYLVPLAADHPMRREWTVVCDSPDLPAALSAWELPGQHGIPDRDRLFEAMWTVEPVAVRDAARVCAAVAADAGVLGAADVVADLEAPPDARPDPMLVTSLFNRVVAYVDDPRRH